MQLLQLYRPHDHRDAHSHKDPQLLRAVLPRQPLRRQDRLSAPHVHPHGCHDVQVLPLSDGVCVQRGPLEAPQHSRKWRDRENIQVSSLPRRGAVSEPCVARALPRRRSTFQVRLLPADIRSFVRPFVSPPHLPPDSQALGSLSAECMGDIGHLLKVTHRAWF
ncbi:unnamed protein product [Ixodes pacificus]